MKPQLRKLLLTAVWMLTPTLAQAHSLPDRGAGWSAGFSHPLHGWDHLLVMLAVGGWAAVQGGRAMWRLPLAFVGVMSLGGVLGAAGLKLPGVEVIVLLSVPVFGLLVARRTRLNPLSSLALVAFFAFFHGLAHGMEMPVSASLVSLAAGFVLATLLLHGAGLIAARLVVVGLACTVGSTVAQTKSSAASSANPTPEPDTNAPTFLGKSSCKDEVIAC